MAARSELTPTRILGLRAVEVVGVRLFVPLIGWTLLIGRLADRDPLPMLLLGMLLAAIVVNWPAAIHPPFRSGRLVECQRIAVGGCR
jgi:uncharacterized membrane protein